VNIFAQADTTGNKELGTEVRGPQASEAFGRCAQGEQHIDVWFGRA
jgi:hypothetical protein